MKRKQRETQKSFTVLVLSNLHNSTNNNEKKMLDTERNGNKFVNHVFFFFFLKEKEKQKNFFE